MDEGAGLSGRVLIVAEEARRMRALVKRPWDDGLEVWAAATVEDAVEAVERLDPDVVVLDLNLPDYGSFEVAGHLAIGRPSLPVLYVSGPDCGDDIVDGFLLGDGEHLRLPADTAHIGSRVRRMIRSVRRSAARPATTPTSLRQQAREKGAVGVDEAPR